MPIYDRSRVGPTKGYKQPGVDISQTISPPNDWHPNIRQPFTGAPNLGPPIANPRPATGPRTPLDPMATIGAPIDVFTNPRNPAYDMPPKPAPPPSYGASGSWDESPLAPHQGGQLPPNVHAQPLPPPPLPLPSTPPPNGPFGAVGALGQAVGQNFQGALPQQPAPPPSALGIVGGMIGQAAGRGMQALAPQYDPNAVSRALAESHQNVGALLPNQVSIGPGLASKVEAASQGTPEAQLLRQIKSQQEAISGRGPLTPYNPTSVAHNGQEIPLNRPMTNGEAQNFYDYSKSEGGRGYMPSTTVGGGFGQIAMGPGGQRINPLAGQQAARDAEMNRRGAGREGMLADISRGPVRPYKAPLQPSSGPEDAARAEKNLLAKGYKKDESGAYKPDTGASAGRAIAGRTAKATEMLNSPERAAYLEKRKQQVANRLGAPNARSIRRDRAIADQDRFFERSLSPQERNQRFAIREQGRLADETRRSRDQNVRDTLKSQEEQSRIRAQGAVDAAKVKAGEAGAKPKAPNLADKDLDLLHPDQARQKMIEEGRSPSEINDYFTRRHGKPGNYYQHPATGQSMWERFRNWMTPPNTGAYGAIPGMGSPSPAGVPAPSGPLAPPGMIAQQKKRIYEGGTGYSPK